MKLLFDQNLSHRLPAHFQAEFPESTHVRLLGLERASDEQVWDFAKAHGFCVVSQDSDFAERSRLRGSPPKVVWLRCGNATPQRVEAILRRNAALIAQLSNDSSLHYVEII